MLFDHLVRAGEKRRRDREAERASRFEEFQNALTRLIDLPAEDDDGKFVSKHVPLSADAIWEFQQFRQFAHDRKDGYDGREREWMAKGPGQVLRLAGTLAYLDWSVRGGPEPERVEEPFMEAAIRLWREILLAT